MSEQLKQNKEGVVQTLSITRQLEVTKQDLVILMWGFIRNSSYWCSSVSVLEGDTVTSVALENPNTEGAEHTCVRCLLNGGKLKLTFKPTSGRLRISESTLESKEITLQDIYTGIQLNALNRPEDMSISEGDNYTLDCIMQYAVYGTLKYV